ncbi:hypothetical protein C1637_05085 [Chryseobacterium lactis]|uniref:Uncharacterized protein n=1 Tax=Chryseobacterium lactis TaxID=1241981 RepID=A0A3G6RN55_CHRLC|nr:hypothetical protein [Chryseobacterium lactis]AZA84221.1 hypothetical protein EG342_21055 [Chryseobacterium lactis]AZB04609.1 hypothetical protein EG341_11935 [Chryseobacterium lactis]PNW14340.1 hypothetical protein C1637_05085 [Chryseobacterium lactis]
MKKLYTTIGLFVAALLSAQVPQAFTYQTIAFNAAGAPVSNGNVSLKISILENTATGTVLYTETHNKTTNSKGLVNLNIGQGTPSTGNFGAINWGANTKFVKIELDPQGGSNYTNVGVNQLMSVPYAQVAKTVVTGAGQGITLVSPNGTNYTLTVDNSGSLNLPVTSGSNAAFPADLYMYGSYNSFNATSAELLRNANGNNKIGYKYLPANTQIKFIAAPAASAQTYGANSYGSLAVNGTSFNATSNGFYKIALTNYGSSVGVVLTNTVPVINADSYNSAVTISSVSYNQSTQKFSATISGASSSNFTGFKINISSTSGYGETFGDNLNDGSLDIDGASIIIPNLTSAPKNFKVEFDMSFNGNGTYTITQI